MVGLLGRLGLLRSERGCLAVRGAIVDKRSLAGALFGIVAEGVPICMLAAFLAVLHGVAMLTASLAEGGGARVVATFECWYGRWVPI